MQTIETVLLVRLRLDGHIVIPVGTAIQHFRATCHCCRHTWWPSLSRSVVWASMERRMSVLEGEKTLSPESCI